MGMNMFFKMAVKYFGDRIVDLIVDKCVELAANTKTDWDDRLAAVLADNREKIKDLIRGG